MSDSDSSNEELALSSNRSTCPSIEPRSGSLCVGDVLEYERARFGHLKGLDIGIFLLTGALGSRVRGTNFYAGGAICVAVYEVNKTSSRSIVELVKEIV